MAFCGYCLEFVVLVVNLTDSDVLDLALGVVSLQTRAWRILFLHVANACLQCRTAEVVEHTYCVDHCDPIKCSHYERPTVWDAGPRSCAFC